MSKRKQAISEEEKALFRDVVSGISPIKQDKVRAPIDVSKKKSLTVETSRTQREANFYFSDEFIPHLSSEGPLSYVAEGQNSYLAKQLRRGDFYPEIMLDLHGLTQADAKLELAALIQACQKDRLRCASVMHGHGQGILKQKLPHWLVQHPAVIAFHQAPKEWGGNAAVLLLVDIGD